MDNRTERTVGWSIASIGPSTPAPSGPGHDDPGLRGFVFALFFAFGGITSLNDVLIRS